MTLEAKAIEVLDEWYSGLKLYADDLPSKGSIGAALHVLGRLRENFDLRISSHVAEGEAQITGLSMQAIRRVLAEFNESRPLSSVGGRSNRGARGDIAALLEQMRALSLDQQSNERRDEILRALQRHIVDEYVPRFFAAKRVKAAFNPTDATWKFVFSLIENARQNGKGGPVAEHLVGAKLSLKFPRKTIRNKPSSAADLQGGFAGDFEIGNTAFHVTLAPMPELFEKCKENLNAGYRVYLLVPMSLWQGASQQAELQAAGKIAVEPIESFISTNIDEFAEFDGNQLKSGLRVLLEKYNARVNEVELDKSLLIEIPPNIH